MFSKSIRKKIINTKFSLVVCLLFLLYFFSNNLIYATSITKTKNDFFLLIKSTSTSLTKDDLQEYNLYIIG